MKRGILALLLAGAILLAGCAKDEEAAANNGGTTAVASHGTLSAADYGEMIVIPENVFVAMTNDIYINPDDYVGKTVLYEGIYDEYVWEETGDKYCSVIRYGPGCCGFDQNAGFEVILDDESAAYPDPDDWVEVVGELEIYEENGWRYLRVRAASMTVLEERGEEYVYN